MRPQVGGAHQLVRAVLHSTAAGTVGTAQQAGQAQQGGRSRRRGGHGPGQVRAQGRAGQAESGGEPPTRAGMCLFTAYPHRSTPLSSHLVVALAFVVVLAPGMGPGAGVAAVPHEVHTCSRRNTGAVRWQVEAWCALVLAAGVGAVHRWREGSTAQPSMAWPRELPASTACAPTCVEIEVRRCAAFQPRVSWLVAGRHAILAENQVCRQGRAGRQFDRPACRQPAGQQGRGLPALQALPG